MIIWHSQFQMSLESLGLIHSNTLFEIANLQSEKETKRNNFRFILNRAHSYFRLNFFRVKMKNAKSLLNKK